MSLRDYWTPIGYAFFGLLLFVMVMGMFSCATLVWRDTETEKKTTSAIGSGDAVVSDHDRIEAILQALNDLSDRLDRMDDDLRDRVLVGEGDLEAVDPAP